jgi:hypothetical protein
MIYRSKFFVHPLELKRIQFTLFTESNDLDWLNVTWKYFGQVCVVAEIVELVQGDQVIQHIFIFFSI